MILAPNPELDLTTSRIIKAPRSLVWSAWADPVSFAEWWIPAPTKCRVVDMDLRPGGSFVTEMSDNGGPFVPHLAACFLDVAEAERIVFTNALTGGWRPAERGFMTAFITFKDHPEGTEYVAYAMHKNRADRDKHEEMGFHDGWGTVAAQLAALVEARAAKGAKG
ncbi:MAG: SRPBCC family protein [Kiloniellales bacterium]